MHAYGVRKSTTVLEAEFLDLLCKVKMQGQCYYNQGTKSMLVRLKPSGDKKQNKIWRSKADWSILGIEVLKE